MAFAPVPGDRQARAILAMFYLQALAGGGLFARIPDIESALALTETQLGLALTGAPAGGLVCVLYAGRLVARIGARRASVTRTV